MFSIIQSRQFHLSEVFFSHSKKEKSIKNTFNKLNAELFFPEEPSLYSCFFHIKLYLQKTHNASERVKEIILN